MIHRVDFQMECRHHYEYFFRKTKRRESALCNENAQGIHEMPFPKIKN